uniref:CG-1 domain-containing protein n=1 Tax=Salarias fasciatus TaxID=181472 RepID=A0A672FAE2_SALFA
LGKKNTASVNCNEESHKPLKIYLPKKLLECLPKCSSLPKERHRWNTNEEIAAYLITFEKHDEWLTTSPKTRPQNGSMILYNRKKVKYRKDGYCWKKRKDGKTTREDHMKLKVQGVEVRGCGGKNKSMIMFAAEWMVLLLILSFTYSPIPASSLFPLSPPRLSLSVSLYF